MTYECHVMNVYTYAWRYKVQICTSVQIQLDTEQGSPIEWFEKIIYTRDQMIYMVLMVCRCMYVWGLTL